MSLSANNRSPDTLADVADLNPRVTAPKMAMFLVLATMLPQGLNISPGGILLTTPRIVLLISLPILLVRILQGQSKPGLRFNLSDAIVCLVALWMFLSVSMTQGIVRSLVGSSVMILELCGSYFLIRASLSRPGETVAVARFLACIIAVDGLLSALDVLTERPFMLDLADSLTGYSQPWQQDYRHGFMRALGMQEHPIAFGNVCAFGALLSLTLMRGFRRVAVLAGCLTGLATSDSSAPIMGFFLACGLLVYHRIMARMAWRWWLLIISGGVFLSAFLAIHPFPFSFLIQHTTSNPQDGFYRLLIWSILGPLVQANPLFGLGLESDWAERFSVLNTIDSFWLASAVNFGIVGSSLLGLMLIGACNRPVRQSLGMTEDDTRLGRSLGIIVFLYIYLGFTVHFWGTCWILIGVFSAMRAHLGDLSALHEDTGETHFLSPSDYGAHRVGVSGHL